MPRTRRVWKTYPINVRELEVLEVSDVTPRMRRIVIGGPQLRAFTTADGIAVPALRNEGFDDHVKVIVPDAGQAHAVPPRQVEGHLDWTGASAAKDYTPRSWDPAGGRLTLDFVRHDVGLASSWAQRARVGDPVHIAGPKSSAMLPPDVDWLLVGGDETALPAIGRLLEEWPRGLPGRVLVEVADGSEEQDLTVPDGVELSWLHRDGVAAGHSELLPDAVRGVPWLEGTPYCWFSGEAVTLKPIRRYLKDKGVPADCVEVTGYWRRTEVTADEVSVLGPRLQQLADLTGPVALRAAINVGLIDALAKGPAAPGPLATELALHEGTVRALLRYLAAEQVVTAANEDPAVAADGAVGLGPLGALLTDEWEQFADPRAQWLDLSVESLVATLHGQPGPAPEVPQDIVDFDASWVTPSLVQHHDWAVPAVSVLGTAGPAVAVQLHQDYPSLPVTTDGVPAPGGVVVGCWWLERYTDDEARKVLQDMAAQCRDRSALLIVAERLREVDEPVHDHDAELDLQLHVAYGSGLRSAAEVEVLLRDSGFETPRSTDLGWDMRSWCVRPK